MFVSLLTIYMISAPSPLITFLSVLIMLVGLIMAQSSSWRDIIILGVVSVIVSMVAIGLVAGGRLGLVGTLIALLLWGLILFTLFTSARRTFMPLPRDRAILIANTLTGSVYRADGPIVGPNMPFMERVIAAIPLYTLSAHVPVEKVNTKRMNVDLIDLQVRYKVKEPQRALGGIPNLSQAQRDVAKDLGKDIPEARLDISFWEQLLNRQMRADVDAVVRDVLYDNLFAQNPIEVQGKRLDVEETIRDHLQHRINNWGGEVLGLNIDRIEVNADVRKAIMKSAGRLDETELKELEAQRDATRIRYVLGAEVDAEAERVRAIVAALKESGVEITPDLLVKALTATADWQMEGDFSMLTQQPQEKK